MHAAQSIQLGINDVVVAGGMESMCIAPKYLAETRKGSRLGHDMVIDGMLKDGLWDVYNDYAMGMCAELCADQRTITREEQHYTPTIFLPISWVLLLVRDVNGLYPSFPALDSISTSISLQIHGNRGISRLIPHHMKHSISTPSFGRHSGGGRDPR
ncbi:hypothetical protein MRB53_023215 [Persea americana]|uniref:Uncharacterized protein n=1 Tax=Persea americana TaxID=3435 RepID=A0ACC2L8S4_PERAE|nr:hypothetical protein MRB53_023215 [Persea americana]